MTPSSYKRILFMVDVTRIVKVQVYCSLAVIGIAVLNYIYPALIYFFIPIKGISMVLGFIISMLTIIFIVKHTTQEKESEKSDHTQGETHD